jgi:hypothetical protein
MKEERGYSLVIVEGGATPCPPPTITHFLTHRAPTHGYSAYPIAIPMPTNRQYGGITEFRVEKKNPDMATGGMSPNEFAPYRGSSVQVPQERAHETPPVLGKETSSAVRSCTTWHSRHWRLLYRRLVAMLAHLGERVLTLRVSYFCPPVICDTELFRARNTGGAIYTPAVGLWNPRT